MRPVKARQTRRTFSVTGECAVTPSAATQEYGFGGGKAFVDFQNDVTSRDLRMATQEGFQSIEHVKRYTTTGMATDQGKTSNMNTLGIMSRLLQLPIPQVGHTTFRMPYTPVTFGALAGTARGALFEPERRTPIHDWAVSQGAVFEDVGTWKRARFFPRDRENMHAAVARECRAVRNAVGIFDATTLGKIEVVGPDAGGVPQPPLHQQLRPTGPRKLPLWRSAERGRIRDGRWCRRPPGTGSLPRHHHDRGCRRCAAPYGRLFADRISRASAMAHLHNGAMGGHRSAGAAGPPGNRTAGAGYRCFTPGDAAHERATRPRLRRSRTTVPSELHR